LVVAVTVFQAEEQVKVVVLYFRQLLQQVVEKVEVGKYQKLVEMVDLAEVEVIHMEDSDQVMPLQ
tara:strand:+ start:123 stop:317 length:195 start_codon:yes stop_codon:yes gene_type:complete